MSLGAPNMTSTVLSFASSHTRRRHGEPIMNSDGYLASSTTDATIRAWIHDAPAEVVAARPEGLEGTRTIQGYTPDEIRVGQSASQTKPDSVVYDGAEFRVYSVTRWGSGPSGAITWYEFLAAGPVVS